MLARVFTKASDEPISDAERGLHDLSEGFKWAEWRRA